MKETETQRMIDMASDDNFQITPDYEDGDIMIIDNVRNLSEVDSPDYIRPNMNVVAICKKGKLQMEVNGEPYEIHQNQMFICPPGGVMANLMISTDFDFVALCITNQALQLCLRTHISEWNQMMYIQKMRVFSMSEYDVHLFDKSYDLIHSFMDAPIEEKEKWKKHEIIRGFVGTGVLGLCFMLSGAGETTAPTPKQNISLFNRFLNLLQSTDFKHQPVDFYASQLCISSKYLTEICKKNSGKTANDWIRESTLSDISYYLRNTQLTIKEVCAKVGFPNTSFLGKYVKDAFGCTPLEYRNKQQ